MHSARRERNLEETYVKNGKNHIISSILNVNLQIPVAIGHERKKAGAIIDIGSNIN